jgi:hypothetical protein
VTAFPPAAARWHNLQTWSTPATHSDPICTPGLVIVEDPPTVPNGGSGGGYRCEADYAVWPASGPCQIAADRLCAVPGCPDEAVAHNVRMCVERDGMLSRSPTPRELDFLVYLRKGEGYDQRNFVIRLALCGSTLARRSRR